jgi:lipopolysaccharide/colanic/teichoic acid biosynthesis glycosyltransferase
MQMNSVVQQRALGSTATRVSSPSTESPRLTILRPSVEAIPEPDRGRRILNVTLAAILMVVLSPLMVCIGLLVMLTSRGPILFTQTRVGIDRRRANSVDGRRRVDYGGRLFKIYKFRTMSADADRAGEVWAQPDDPRVTTVGRVLRSIGWMSCRNYSMCCGRHEPGWPRPEQPKIFGNLRHRIENYADRQRVLPGITGLAQVSLHYDNSIDDVRRKLSFDLEYIDRRSVQQDLKVLLQTVPVVIFKKGAW